MEQKDVSTLRKTSIGRKLGFLLLVVVLFLFSILLVITSNVIKSQTTERDGSRNRKWPFG